MSKSPHQPTQLSIEIGTALAGYMVMKIVINHPGGDHGHHDKRCECTGCPALPDCPMLEVMEFSDVHFISEFSGGSNV